MRPLSFVALLVLCALPLGSAQTLTLGSGHLTLGAPTTAFATTTELGAPAPARVDSFTLAAPAEGTLVKTATVDHGGLGHDVDLYFLDAAGRYVGGCVTNAADEQCVVPAGVASVEVTATQGLDLDVTLLAITQ